MKNHPASPKGGPAQHSHHTGHHTQKHGFSRYFQNPYAVPILAIGLIIGLLTGLSMKSSGPPQTNSSANPPSTTQNPQLSSSATRIIYEITAANDRFNPSEIRARVGEIVSLFIYAEDKIYDVVIPALGLEKIIHPGDRKFLEFPAVSAGRYTFTCKSCGSFAQGLVIVEKK